MKIEKLKSGSYRIRKTYRKVSYSVVVDYKPTQKEALQLITAELDKVQNAKNRMTFETAANKYIEMKTNVLSASTIREYYGLIRRLSDSFIAKRISDITAIDIQKEINLLAQDKSPKTVRNFHGFISAVMGTFAPNTVIHTTLPQKQRVEPHIPSDEDVKKIFEHIKGSKYEVAITLACFGLRRSEICALTPDDIDGNIVHINKALVQNKDKQWVIKLTKTENGTRDVWIPDEVADLIRRKGTIYSGHPNSISRYLKDVQKKLYMEPFSLHKLRHYFASISHALGIPDSYIMAAGGWKSDNVLKNVYRHALKDKENDMQKIAGNYLKDMMFS